MPERLAILIAQFSAMRVNGHTLTGYESLLHIQMCRYIETLCKNSRLELEKDIDRKEDDGPDESESVTKS